MRFLGAVAIFVIGLVASAVGLVDQLQNRPLDLISVTQDLETPTTYVVIPNRVLSAYPGQVTVSAKNADGVFIATARESDIEAWVGESQSVQIRLALYAEKETIELIELERAGTGELIEPFGSDIWRSFSQENDVAWISVPEGNESGVLVASTGLAMAPREVKITWDLPNQASPIAPITFIGLTLMAIGAALALIQVIRGRSKTRPTRANRGPASNSLFDLLRQLKPAKSRGRRVKRSMSLLGTGLILAILSGCSPEYVNPILNPSPSPQVDILTPAVTRAQIERILKEIEEAIAASDAELDREILETRVAGPALSVRRSFYNLARRTEAQEPPAPILAEPIQLFLPSATDTWPRSAMVVTGEDALQMLILRQESPREPYKLYQYMNLLPDIIFPEVAAESVGASALKPESKFLLIAPKDLALAVGDLLNNGLESGWVGIVDAENQYIMDVSAVQQGLITTLTSANLDFVHKITSDAPVLLSSAEGGALVGLYMTDTYTIIPKEPGNAVAITGDEALLLGTGGSATGIESRYGAMLLFHVPQAGSTSKVTLLGATQQLLTTTALGTR